MRKIVIILSVIAIQVCFGQTPTLTITEVNYNSDSTQNPGDWFEIYNYGPSTIDLSLYRLRDSSGTGLYLIQPGVTIPAGGYLVFCADTQQFDAIYNITNRIGNLGYGLNNNTDGIRIFDNLNLPVIEMYYQDSLPWPIGADGFGRTLELSTVGSNPADPASWKTGCVLGSPGGPYISCVNETIVVSEINYKSSPTQNAGDWFEVRNIGSTPVDIGNYGVRNHKNDLHYLIPPGTVLDPQEMVVIYNTPALFLTQFPFVSNKVGPFLFGLDGDGDAIRLYNANDKIIFSVYYDDDNLWPNQPDGFGYTLEADTNFLFARDVNNSTSWFAGCPEGTPGFKYNPDCLGGTNDEQELSLLVFPNPTSDFIQIQFKEPLNEWTSTIYNTVGQTISKSENNTSLNLSNLTNGNYILEIQSQSTIVRKKIIVLHE
jgi:hypothetical protein